ncbi:hypothetical protein RUND412_002869, partial [Rhizina undulata]
YVASVIVWISFKRVDSESAQKAVRSLLITVMYFLKEESRDPEILKIVYCSKAYKLSST